MSCINGPSPACGAGGAVGPVLAPTSLLPPLAATPLLERTALPAHDAAVKMLPSDMNISGDAP
jgi:hypothetical protein